jgi:hypothetical protein
MDNHEIQMNKSLAQQAMKQPNVAFYEGAKAPLDTSTLVYEFERPLNEIVWPLVTKFPYIEWRIHGRMDRRNENIFHVRGMYAYREGVDVGSIGTTHTYSGVSFVLRCDAIADARVRGNGMRTSKHNVVMSTVRNKFAPKSVNKIIQEAKSKLNSLLNTKAYYESNSLDEYKKRISDALFLVLNQGSTIYDLVEQHVGEVLLTKYTEQSIKMAKLEDLRKQFTDEEDKLVVVLVDKNSYIVSGGEHIAKYDSTTLPTDIRKNLGLLKLLDKDEEVLPDVGARLNESVFLVIKDMP